MYSDRKISFLSKLNHKFNKMPIKISIRIFMELHQLILKYIWKSKGLRITKSQPKKTTVGDVVNNPLIPVIQQLFPPTPLK